MNRKLIFLILASFMACTSLHQVSKVAPESVDAVLLSAGLKVKAAGPEFKCDSLMTLYTASFAEPLLSQTLKCLNSIKQGSVTYSYQFGKEPSLVWKSADKGAECMKTVLPKMKLPRELYFVGTTHTNTELECFANNFNTTADKFVAVKYPWDRYKLEIQFPLSRELKNSTDLQIWFMVTLLESIKAEMDGALKGSVVPESLCKSCFIDTPWFDEKRKEKIPGVYWP